MLKGNTARLKVELITFKGERTTLKVEWVILNSEVLVLKPYLLMFFVVFLCWKDLFFD